MKEYVVVLRRQRHANFVYRPQGWVDFCEEFHRLEASSDEEAIAKARELVDWVDERLSADSIVETAQLVKLQAIYNSQGECVWSYSIRGR